MEWSSGRECIGFQAAAIAGEVRRTGLLKGAGRPAMLPSDNF
ncbi:MAG: hypothetical protein PVJ75_02315 [Chloroflexota bacterium]|jgi:hypothetical protein